MRPYGCVGLDERISVSCRRDRGSLTNIQPTEELQPLSIKTETPNQPPP